MVGAIRAFGRYDARSAATLISTGGVFPLPLIGLIWPYTLRPGGLIPLLAVWAFITCVFVYTVIRPHLTDVAFGVVGACGILGICASALILAGPQSRQAVLGMVTVIPTIAAISGARILIWGLVALATGASAAVALATASTLPTAVICMGATVGIIVVPVFLVLALRSSLERTIARQTLLSGIDPLTGILNRRGFFARVEQLLAAARVSAGWVGILLMDIDHFKRINDAHGHLAGDGVLLATAAAIREVAPSGSVVCRFGGEEILVFCLIRDEEELHHTAEGFRLAVAEATPVTMSIGGVCASLITSTRDDAATTDDVIGHLLRQADECVYVAKRQGRNSVHVQSMNPIFWRKSAHQPSADSVGRVPFHLVELLSRQSGRSIHSSEQFGDA